MSILTVALNPAVDLTAYVQDLQIDAVNRYQRPQLDPAGKGVNVARMTHQLGWSAVVLGILAGEIGGIIPRALHGEGIPAHFIQVNGQTRVSVTIVDETRHTVTSLFGPGPSVDRDHLDQLDALLHPWLKPEHLLVLDGSLPPGVPDGIYAVYLRRAKEAGMKTILDADGEAMRQGIAARPDVIKPNIAEAERILGRALPNLPAIVQGAKDLAGRGVAIVVISMGEQGAIGIEGGTVWHAIPPRVPRRSTVGSGDSFVAGLAVALARGQSLVEGLRWGTAAGAATAMTAGTAQGTREEIQVLLPRVAIEELP